MRADRSTVPGARREAALWAVCAAFAGLLALVTALGTHRLWGTTATVGYAVAACVVARGRALPGRLAALAGSVVVPLVVLVARGRAQLEVDVVERSGALLPAGGSPYVERPLGVEDYNPYLPGMAVFGLPRALWGDFPLADARWWFAAAFLASMAGAARAVAARSPAARRWPGIGRHQALVVLAAFPAVALPLAVGGTDLPVVGLMCLAPALASRGAAGRAGLAMGAAAALKWTAWPLLPVVLVLLASVRGGRAALRAAGAAGGVLLVAVAPVVAAHPATFVEQLVLFPLGRGGAASPAASPLPGHLVASFVPGGFVLATVALVLGAVAVGVRLFKRPPRDAHAAADLLAVGLALAMCLAPATRFGYLLYPFVLAGWFRLASISSMSPSTSFLISSRMGRTASTPWPAGSSSFQSR